MHRLGCKTQVSLHRDTGFDDRFDRWKPLLTPFKFNSVHSTLLQESTGVTHRFIHGGLVGHERHIADHKRVFSAASHRFAVMDHVIHGHREGGLVA